MEADDASYTDTHVLLGGTSIYVDEDCREDLIPKGTLAVVKLQKGLK